MTYRVGKYTLPEYSVLMSVYDRELPENLNESLESMLMQSYPRACVRRQAHLRA